MPTFATPAPITVSVDIDGNIRVTASDRADTVVTVRPLDAEKAADVKGAGRTVVDFADDRLSVQLPKHWARHTPFGGGGESIEVTIEVPTGSRLDAVTGVGDIHGDGELGPCLARTGMGDIRLDHTAALRATTGFGAVTVDRVAGDLEVATGSGAVRLGEIDGSAVIKNSNGPTTIAAAGAEVRVKAANGDITVERAGGSVTAKTANGSIRIGEVSRGRTTIETAAGELSVGIGGGSAAWLDLRSHHGRVRNDLDDADGPGAADATLEVKARTAVGDIVVHRSSTLATPRRPGSEPT